MKKKIIGISLIILIIIVLIIILINNNKSLYETSKEIFNNNELGFVNASKSVTKYNTGDAFFIADESNVIEKDQYSDGSYLKDGDTYVWHDYGEEESQLEKIEDEAIESILLEKDITHIYKDKDIILFHGNNSLNKDQNEYWAIYYSLDSKPHADSWFTDEKLKKDGKGWSIKLKDGQECFTRQIKNNYYFIEGIKLP